jgi:hypothetical protein
MDDLDAHKHIPEILATGKFFCLTGSGFWLRRNGGVTYSVQYTTDSKKTQKIL